MLVISIVFTATESTEEEINNTGNIEEFEEQPQLLKTPKLVPEKTPTEVRIKCEICTLVFKKKSNLLQHQRIVHMNDRRFTCDTCGRKFAYKTDFTRHQQWIHLNVYSFLCHICGALFKVQRALQRHVAVVHNKQKTGGHYKCEICQKTFTTKNTLIIHHRSHTGEHPYMCEVCGKLFKADSARRTHVMLKHNVDVKQKSAKVPSVKCEVCGKAFKWKSSLKEHERIHTKERPFLCRICGKSFAHRNVMSAHVKSIHNVDDVRKTRAEPKHKCTICEKTFWQKSKLVQHIGVHTGEKPFVCNICGRSFRQRPSLRMHMKNIHELS